MRFEVEGMTCGHCVQAVQEAVREIAPAAAVEVTLEPPALEVRGPETPGLVERVVAAVQAAGYAAKRVAAITALLLPLLAADRLAVATAGAEEPMHDHGAVADDSPAAQAFRAANDTMMEGMDAEPTGDADRDFATMMLPHHRGAVDMARAQLAYGTDPELRALAERIIEDQQKEIAQLEKWLALHP